MKKLFVFCVLLGLVVGLQAQELNATVIVNSDKISGSNKQVFNSMQKDMQEFLNLHRWTDMQFQPAERIDCNFVITISSVTDEKTFKGDLQIQARRTVYNATYYTTLFNFKDNDFTFDYIEHSPVEFVEGSFTSNMTAVLAYYAYIVIGLDCDSYEKMGGTPYFNKAEAIVNLAQSQSVTGWKAFENDRNRYALINNLLDNNLVKFRETYYEYHRLGLDEMANSASKGSAKIAESLQNLREVNRARPSCVALMSFLEAKRDEIVNIYSKAPSKEKTDVYNLLMDIDPSQSAKYEPILKN